MICSLFINIFQMRYLIISGPQGKPNFQMFGVVFKEISLCLANTFSPMYSIIEYNKTYLLIHDCNDYCIGNLIFWYFVDSQLNQPQTFFILHKEQKRHKMSLVWSLFTIVNCILWNKKMNGHSDQFGESRKWFQLNATEKRITTKSYKTLYIDVVATLENIHVPSV